MTDEAVRAVAALDDELRRRMYAFIRQSQEPVTRDEAAQSVGISRKLAAFHLDKLVEVGLLVATYAQPGGIRKVGRAPKLYQPSDLQVQVSIPPREHSLLAEILLDAVRGQRPEESGPQAAVRVAGDRGRELGQAERRRLKPGRLGTERALTYVGHMLERHGFEPSRVAPTRLRLDNCPFHPLAAKDPDLVCGINHAFLTAYCEGLGATTVKTALVPRPGACCVELGATP
ncbi:helix-turn-helix domain-containing protein [Nonomuraea phyllanthi]|uniref:Helix-turn-helix domain-containing protein n=1 Tax=Nonomuraea phyllanthi TaxID=2219224 RepID=A0A5C4WV13_9ACTN|nr:helix-turn-helix domain-containing protein [Nonomuraea phyllanthi]KAB8197440.1 helix-turn-helix domain-containing protein [Nonomuraea phyllanthi]